MSKRRKPPRPAVPPPPPGGWPRPSAPKVDGIWVISDLVDGNYRASISVGDDLSFVVEPDRAIAYAAQVYAVVIQAAHDTAVIRQLSEKVGVPMQDAARLVIEDLRPDRPPTNHAATHPLEFYAGVSMNPETGALRGHVVISLEGSKEEWGRWGLPEARRHGIHVLEVASGVDLDSGYYRALVGQLGVESDRARAVVNDLANFYEPWEVATE